MKPRILFIINLLQDVNIVRGLVYLAARETEAQIGFLLSRNFMKRDKQQSWQYELGLMAQDVGADLHFYADAAELYAILQGGRGIIFAASESNLGAHWEASMVFQVAPSDYITVTLQHGLECVGFLQSREHILSHGRNIGFRSDVVCAWFEAPALTSMIPSERSKLYVSGPPTLLQAPVQDTADHPQPGGGIVCENMHSVRLQATGDHKASFMDVFFQFCAKQAEEDRNVSLRPHPGGQYVIKNNVALPQNVHLNNLPIFHVNMSGYEYGISAPSTIVFDMILAGIPVGVWRDPGGVMDAGNYSGLTQVDDLASWLAFVRDVRLRRDMIMARQQSFLERLQMPTDRSEVYRRFAKLMIAGLSGRGSAPASNPVKGSSLTAPTDAPKRILFISNGIIPTLQLSFLKPLAPLVEKGKIKTGTVTEQDIIEKFQTQRRSAEARAWMLERVGAFEPDLIVCCRYSGPHADAITTFGKKHNIPVIYHVDDDLLNIPPEIGEKKYRVHSDPKRLNSVRTLMDRADLRYFSTPKLQARFQEQGFHNPGVAGSVYCAAKVLRSARPGPVRRIGYMGFDHAHDFNIALPALEKYLAENPLVEFELFGSIPMPEQLKPFEDRVREVPPVRDYAAFLQALAEREWDIGICPLVQSPFNAVKANTKWVEYTACGMATIASKGLVYDECAGQGRGILVEDDGWEAALRELTAAPEWRLEIAQAAQAHLQAVYSDQNLQDQIQDTFDRAFALKHAGEHRPSPVDCGDRKLGQMLRALRFTAIGTLAEDTE